MKSASEPVPTRRGTPDRAPEARLRRCASLAADSQESQGCCYVSPVPSARGCLVTGSGSAISRRPPSCFADTASSPSPSRRSVPSYFSLRRRSSTGSRAPMRALPRRTTSRRAGRDCCSATKGAVCSRPADNRRTIELDDDQQLWRRAIATRDCARWRGIARAIACASNPAARSTTTGRCPRLGAESPVAAPSVMRRQDVSSQIEHAYRMRCQVVRLAT
jgi:hypothetical protein